MAKIYDTFEAFQQAYQFDFTNLDSLLGHGNYGQVVKGWQLDENREVAIKCSFRPGDDSVRREFEGAGDLNHPNIARYMAYGRLMVHHVGLRDFTVMQYYPDGNLHTFIHKLRWSRFAGQSSCLTWLYHVKNSNPVGSAPKV
jgi:serine/threonine protein kinase